MVAFRPLQIMEKSSEWLVSSITQKAVDSKRECKYTTNKERGNAYTLYTLEGKRMWGKMDRMESREEHRVKTV